MYAVGAGGTLDVPNCLNPARLQLIQYWTIVLFSPAVPYDDDYEEESISSSLQTYMMVIISRILREATRDLTRLVDSIGGILEDDYTFLSPELHVKLINDDDDFTRSRRYFWYSNTLQALESNSDDNIKHCRSFCDSHIARLITFLRGRSPKQSRL